MDYGQANLPPARVDIQQVPSVHMHADVVGTYDEFSKRLEKLRQSPLYLCAAYCGQEPNLSIEMRFAFPETDSVLRHVAFRFALRKEFADAIGTPKVRQVVGVTQKVRVVEL